MKEDWQISAYEWPELLVGPVSGYKLGFRMDSCMVFQANLAGESAKGDNRRQPLVQPPGVPGRHKLVGPGAISLNVVNSAGQGQCPRPRSQTLKRQFEPHRDARSP